MTKQVIVMRKDLNMRKGKIAAQAAHASLGVFTDRMSITNKLDAQMGHFYLNFEMIEWFQSSFTKICVACDSQAELLALLREAESAGLPCKLITDNGTTEFNGTPTDTCIAIGPAESGKIDRITGHLKLL